jgi:D-alanyl-lipoteichoic acid acyltransferase DltB (MBOAT superfamily)
MSLSRWLRDYLHIPLGGNRTAGFASYFILAAILLIAAFRLQNLWFTLAVCTIIAVVLLLLAFRPSHRRTLGTNVNNMDTMLLGGLWHGSSFNFITWGGLNGLGILVYKWWKDRSWTTRLLTLLLLATALTAASYLAESSLVNLLAFCLQVLLGGYLVLFLLSRIRHATSFNGHLSTVWSVLITFVFISFTRLFFRSGSNLDPAEANETAWRTASQMVQQIGSHWNLAQVPDILSNYAPVFILFALGMAVHWLPERFKRRYRLWFASTPLWLMGLGVVLLAVVLYQFVTADLQPFIYFQF